jgi:uncharacterized protein YpmB
MICLLITALVVWLIPLANILISYNNQAVELKNEYDSSIKGNYGENIVSNCIEHNLSNDYYLINDLVIPSGVNNTTQIDHVLIGTNIIYCVETKHWHGKFYPNKRGWKWYPTNGYVKDVKIVNDSPQKQSIYHAKKLSAQLIRYGINIKVLPIVVLTHHQSKWMGSFDKECPVLYIEDLVSFINRFSENNIPVNADRKSAVDLANKILKMNTATENKVSSGTKNVWLSTNRIDIVVDEIVNDAPLPKPPQDIMTIVLTKDAPEPKIPEKISLAQKATNESSAKVLIGKNKDGRDYVRVVGSKDEAEAIRAGYLKDGINPEPLKADRFIKDAWYFYTRFPDQGKSY